MDWSDDDSAVCADCGERIEDVGLERAFVLTSEEVLCYGCSRARGGAYDELKDRWVTAPNLRELLPRGEWEFGKRGVVT